MESSLNGGYLWRSLDPRVYRNSSYLWPRGIVIGNRCEELTHWNRPWCWERLKAGGEGDAKGWDDWMASWTQWTWVWAGFQIWWWTEKAFLLQSLGYRVGHDWVTELIWADPCTKGISFSITWELIGNADYWTPFQTYWVRNSWIWSPALSILTCHPGDTDVHWSLRATSLRHRFVILAVRWGHQWDFKK